MDLRNPKTRAEAENLLALKERYTTYGLAKRIDRPRATVQTWVRIARAMLGPDFEPGLPTYDPTVREAPEPVEKPRVRVKAGSSRYEYAGRPFTVVHYTDAHHQGGLDPERFLWLSRLINDVKPDCVVDGGDADDFHSLCLHERNDTYKGKLKPTLERDLAAAAEMRRMLSVEITHQCRKVLTLGNHEDRVWRYGDLNPEMHGIATNIYTGMLESHGWEWHKFGEYVRIENVDFVHVPFNGNGKAVGGDTASKTVADKSLRDVVWGHTHRLDHYCSAKFGPAASVVSLNAGCFMPLDYVPSYAQNTRKEFWYGAHVLSVAGGRLKAIKSYHITELQAIYS